MALGNPHFSLAECARLGELCSRAAARGEAKHDGVALVVTTGRQTLAAARAAGHAATLEAFGATLLTDTCWCVLGRACRNPDQDPNPNPNPALSPTPTPTPTLAPTLNPYQVHARRACCASRCRHTRHQLGKVRALRTRARGARGALR